MVFLHFRILSEGLIDSSNAPLRFDSGACKCVLIPCLQYFDTADLFIFGDSYKDILCELKVQESDGLLENYSPCSFLYFGSSEDSYCSAFDLYNIYFTEDKK